MQAKLDSTAPQCNRRFLKSLLARRGCDRVCKSLLAAFCLWSLYGPQAWIQKEFGWADGVYSGVHHLIAPFRKPKHAPLAIDWHGWFRARVEHTFATLWSFNLIKHVWPGRGEEGLRRLGNRLKVLMHFINFCEKRKRRYPPYGPWPHFQEVEVDAQPICDVASDSDSSSHED